MAQSQTEHLTLAELLGGVRAYDQLPQGWIHPKAIAQIAIGTQVFIKNLRTREWELGTVKDYWERGAFLNVFCGKRCQMIFSNEHIAVKCNGGYLLTSTVKYLGGQSWTGHTQTPTLQLQYMDLVQKLYQSIVEALKESDELIPSWEEMPQDFRDKFEAQVNDFMSKLAIM